MKKNRWIPTKEQRTQEFANRLRSTARRFEVRTYHMPSDTAHERSISRRINCLRQAAFEVEKWLTV